jgi:hypothetical protein
MLKFTARVTAQRVVVLGSLVKKLKEIEELSVEEDEDEFSRSDIWLEAPSEMKSHCKPISSGKESNKGNLIL